MMTEKVKAAVAGCTLGALVLAGASAAVAANPSDAAFIAQVNDAMTKMMAAMGIKSSGDADKDFVATMVAHHEVAIASFWATAPSIRAGAGPNDRTSGAVT